MKKLIKFEGITWLPNVLTFDKARVLRPSITVAEYEKLTGNKVPKAESKKEEAKSEKSK